MQGFPQLSSLVRPLAAAVVLIQIVACTGNIQSPTPSTPSTPVVMGANRDVACPMNIPDQATNICPRLKNITVACGGNGMMHTSFDLATDRKPALIRVTLDEGTVLSAVLVVFNCQDGPREGVTLGVVYTGQVAQRDQQPPCISQSKAVYSQFVFGDPAFAPFEGFAKEQLHKTFDEEAINTYTSQLGLPRPVSPRCDIWRTMP